MRTATRVLAPFLWALALLLCALLCALACLAVLWGFSVLVGWPGTF